MNRPEDQHVEPDALDEDAVLRIAQVVADRGPKLVKRGRQIRIAKRAGAATLAAVGLFFLLRSSPAPEQPSLTVEPPLACAGWTPVRATATGFEMGPRGHATFTGEVELASAAACQTEFRLLAGTITVNAADLGGGALTVETPEATIAVRGTLFQVARVGEQTTVATVEGLVEVVGRGKVASGKKARVAADAFRLESLSAEEVVSVTSAFSEPQAMRPTPVEKKRRKARRKRKAKAPPLAVPPPRPLSTEAMIKQAHQARRAGAYDEARDWFQRAGAGQGTTAEAAWIGLARMELAQSRPTAALRALDRRQRRFGGGTLSLEGAGLRLQALAAAGRTEEARRHARKTVERWPRSAQADEAKRWLEANR